MTPQEQQMIDGLIGRIRNTPVQSKDTEAEQHIQQGLGSDPDALYVLVQTVLVQQYGLQQAQSQINELKKQVGSLQEKLDEAGQQAKSSGGSFLSHIFGSGGSSATASNTNPQPQSPQYQPVNNPGYGGQGSVPPPPPVYPSQGYSAQGYPVGGYPPQGAGMFGGGGGGFLQGAMQTAAGVAAGELVFQGMEDLFHGFGHGGYGRGFEGGGGGETIINNYNDDDRGDRDDRRDRDFGDRGRDDSSFYNPDNDASRMSDADEKQGGGDVGNFAGDSMNFGGNDTGSNDLSFDNSGGNDDFASNVGDDSSFDDSSSDFSSSDNS